ncbi:unnamed protein product [Lactuca saligna]|uniref:SWIM-type domain-containing protein n=1 Tax=Lactuca saligna TaxID=75948 RepID=A0AA35Z1Y3_LACSI|nr:unnamed protein product [Lactuca saligna]
MVFVMWAIRPKGETYNITNEYERVPTMFSIKLHHGGNFTKLPNTKYVKDLDFGLRALGNDNDVLNLAQYIGDNKVIEVYTEHGKTNLLTYFMSPKGKQKVIIKELCDGDLPKEANVPQVPAKDKTPMIDEANDQTQLAGYMSLILFDKVPTQVSPQYRRNGRVNAIVGQSSCAKKLCLVELDDVVEDQGGDHAKLDDVVQDQGGENPKLDDVVQDQAGEHANMNDVVQDQEVEHANMDDVVQDQGGDHDNFDYDEFHYENFSHDHFDGEHYQPSEDENVEDHQSEHEKSADNDDLRQQSEEQYDELVDDENNVSEVEVDMTDFNLNLDKDYGCVQMDGFHNGVGTNDEHEDIEVIDNDRWDSLDEGSEDERKRRCVLKNLAKEKRCSLGNVHKASFYVGQKFKSKKELKEKIDMHALETRRNLYYKKNDKIRLRALCRDRQKGLIPTIAQLFPCAEHSNYDKEACEWLRKIPPKHWARSHFTGRAISDILLNNLCEVFNSKIIKGGDKPIIGCLEYIRQYLMKRICNVMKVMDKAKGPLTPTATTILDANKSHASHYIARWNGGEKYQVTGAWQDQHVVDVRNNTCTCRKWELIGIPCKHAIATLMK